MVPRPKIVLYVPLLNLGGPPISEMSNFQIANQYNFCSTSEFFLAIDSKVLIIGGTFLGIRLSIYVLKGWYDEPPQNLPITVILGEQAPPVLISKSERPYWQGFNWFLILAIFHLDFIIVMLKFIIYIFYIKIEFFRCYYTILIKARTL